MIRMELPVIAQDVALSLDEHLTAAGADTTVTRTRGVWTVNATFEPKDAFLIGRVIADFPGGWAE